MKNYQWFGLCPVSQGHYKFTTFKRGNICTLLVTDMEIVDLIKNRERGWITAVKKLRIQSNPAHKSIKH